MAQNKKKETRRTYGYFSATVRSGGIVIVEVGPKRAIYPLHKAMLAQHSEYFARALNGPWAEAEDRKVVLEDVELGISSLIMKSVNVFVNYIYGQDIPHSIRQWPEATEQDRTTFTETKCWRMADLAHVQTIYLADRIVAPDFKKALQNL
ncbi:hypothetical protein P171DRAFT_81669 [Karstenula rhodostoma CBS 690.94]|uniref:BTB domain-containing protein n=1 Tax=Karstenula rhodostoma CBS 690.94 TaxID=1392251 RepID=A0A9P4UA42_9PLEO|nr:hypothetical protein P171DRAFT_81669 [Karstenula rhodostoma CBS 690.94]